MTSPSKIIIGHGHNRALTLKKVAFPKLYAELDRAHDHLGPRSVKHDQVAILPDNKPYPHAQAHVLIYNGQVSVYSLLVHLIGMLTQYQLYVVDEKIGACNRARTLSGLANLYRAIVALPDPRMIPNVEFVIDVEDTPQGNAPDDRIVWAWTRPKDNEKTWLMPDFDGWAFPDPDLGSYTSFRDRLRFFEKPFAEKDPRAVWRGNSHVNDIRKSLLETTSKRPWADVLDTNAHPEHRIHMADFCSYKFPIHTEGNSWSGRLRYLQNCNSATIIHDLHWMAHYYPLLEPNGPEQNYIRVDRDWSDLEAEVNFYTAHPREAERIAANSAATFRDRYLTPAAEACYWRRMIRRWAEVQAFEPVLYVEERDAAGKVFHRQRGLDWEVFAHPDPNFRVELPGSKQGSNE